tara:strand:- start:193 stop:582 length:390 start_codon:yes stop_codon:yes gene_type:complete
MVKTIDNKFAVFVIILIVVGLFLHYEMGYNFDLFTVGGNKGNHNRHRKWGWHHYHYDRYRDIYHYPYISSHEPSIYEKHNQLKKDYDTLKAHHDSRAHDHGEKCPNCTSDDDPNKHTGGTVHSAIVYSV